MVTPTATRPLRLVSVQTGTNSGATPPYQPENLHRALWRVVRRRATKIMLDFEDEYGELVCITLRNIGTAEKPEWTMYGFWTGDPDWRIDGVPTMEDVTRHLLSR